MSRTLFSESHVKDCTKSNSQLILSKGRKIIRHQVMNAKTQRTMKLNNFVCVVIFSTFLVVETGTESAMDRRAERELARAHFQRVASEIDCKNPRPRIIRVDNNPMEIVVPRATVVYRCGEHSGCCKNPMQKCVAKTKTEVMLYFVVKSLPKLSGRKRGKSKVHKVVYSNHTECHCVDIQQDSAVKLL